MKNIPKKIYLNLGFDKDEIDIKDIDDFEGLVGVSWSDTRINDQDIEYVLSERKESTDSKALNIPDVSKQRELLIAFGKKVASDMLRSDKIMSIEDSFKEFKSNL